MPNITKRLLSDAILFRIGGGNVDIASPVEKTDIFKAIEQLINSMFRMEQFTQNLPNGETIPSGVMIATYTDIDVVTYGNVSKSSLPVIPISLPKNIGIWGITPAMSLSLTYSDQFIPLMRGQNQLLRSDTLLNDMMGMIAYEPRNSDVVFTKNLILLGITKVDFELLVFDISTYSETDILPIPSSYEADIVNTLVAQFGSVRASNSVVNLLTTYDKAAN